jgi:hypothetical protein
MQAGAPEEERQRGVVKKGQYLAYLHSWGPALVVPVVVIVMAFSYQGFMVRS